MLLALGRIKLSVRAGVTSCSVSAPHAAEEERTKKIARDGCLDSGRSRNICSCSAKLEHTACQEIIPSFFFLLRLWEVRIHVFSNSRGKIIFLSPFFVLFLLLPPLPSPLPFPTSIPEKNSTEYESRCRGSGRMFIFFLVFRSLRLFSVNFVAFWIAFFGIFLSLG